MITVQAAAVAPRNVAELARERPEIVSFEHNFETEDTDPVRAPAMEAWILGEVSRKAMGVQITNLDVECHSTLCRVQMAFPLQILQKQGPPLPRDTRRTGKEPVGFFIQALDVEFCVGCVFAGLDTTGTPTIVGYASMPPQPPGI